jgi:Uma2 family endonuclease
MVYWSTKGIVMTTASQPTSVSALKGEPTWDIARLFPTQGHWSVQEYLDLQGNHLVEFSNGYVEVLPMPTMRHQLIVALLWRLLSDFVDHRQLGRTLFAPFRIRLSPVQIREPDVVVMLSRNAHRMSNEYWDGADLVVEVVSDSDRLRDLETKRTEYARAGIPEYWIVDPQTRTITVLTLNGSSYAVHGEFGAGARADSVLLAGFSVAADEVFAVR